MSWRRLAGRWPLRSPIAGWTARIMPSAARTAAVAGMVVNGCSELATGPENSARDVSRRRQEYRRKPRWRRPGGRRPTHFIVYVGLLHRARTTHDGGDAGLVAHEASIGGEAHADDSWLAASARRHRVAYLLHPGVIGGHLAGFPERRTRGSGSGALRCRSPRPSPAPRPACWLPVARGGTRRSTPTAQDSATVLSASPPSIVPTLAVGRPSRGWSDRRSRRHGGPARMGGVLDGRGRASRGRLP